MKSARIITNNLTKAKLSSNGKSISLPVAKRKTPKATGKITSQAQFASIKEALQEVELIEEGKLKLISLKEALNGL